MEANYLKELRELRNQEKAIKARIDEISDEATREGCKRPRKRRV